MKITKRQLKRIIREEYNKLREGNHLQRLQGAAQDPHSARLDRRYRRAARSSRKTTNYMALIDGILGSGKGYATEEELISEIKFEFEQENRHRSPHRGGQEFDKHEFKYALKIMINQGHITMDRYGNYMHA